MRWLEPSCTESQALSSSPLAASVLTSPSMAFEAGNSPPEMLVGGVELSSAPMAATSVMVASGGAGGGGGEGDGGGGDGGDGAASGGGGNGVGDGLTGGKFGEARTPPAHEIHSEPAPQLPFVRVIQKLTCPGLVLGCVKKYDGH